MTSRVSCALYVAFLLCIGGIMYEHVDAACSTVTNCLTCDSVTTVCTNCSSNQFGLNYVDTTHTDCQPCNASINCAQCSNVHNCTRCKDVSSQGPDYGKGSCSNCSEHCRRCGSAGGGLCDSCNPGYLANPTTHLCEACSANCSTCTTSGAGKCDVCVDGYGINAQLCEPCKTGCAKCARNVSQCTTCTSSAQVVLKDGTGTCANCAEHCDNCTTSGAGQCDVCSATYAKANGTNGMTICQSTSNCNIMPRSSWTSRMIPGSVPDQEGGLTSILFHITMTEGCESGTTCPKRISDIENYQIKYVGQMAIGYNLLISSDGVLFEGRGAGKVGGVSGMNNKNVLNVALIVKGIDQVPTAAALTAIGTLLGADCRTYLNVTTDAKYNHHSDVDCATRCPGHSIRDAVNGMYASMHGTIKPGCADNQRAFPKVVKK